MLQGWELGGLGQWAGSLVFEAAKKNDVKVRKGRLGCRAALGKVRKTSGLDTHCVSSVLDTHSVLFKV